MLITSKVLCQFVNNLLYFYTPVRPVKFTEKLIDAEEFLHNLNIEDSLVVNQNTDNDSLDSPDMSFFED